MSDLTVEQRELRASIEMRIKRLEEMPATVKKQAISEQYAEEFNKLNEQIAKQFPDIKKGLQPKLKVQSDGGGGFYPVIEFVLLQHWHDDILIGLKSHYPTQADSIEAISQC